MMLAMFRSDEICTASWAGGDPTWPDQPRGSKCDVGLTGDVLEASCPVVRQLNVGQVPFTVFLSAERALLLLEVLQLPRLLVVKSPAELAERHLSGTYCAG